MITYIILCYFNLIGVYLGNRDMEAIIFQTRFQTCGELQEYIHRVMKVAGIKVWVKYVIHYILRMEPNFGGHILVTKTYKSVTELFRGLAKFTNVSRIEIWRGNYNQSNTDSSDHALRRILNGRRSTNPYLNRKFRGKTVQSKSNSENFEVKETAVSSQPISVSEGWNHENESNFSDWDDLTTTPAVVESRAVANKQNLAPPKTKNNTPRGPTGKHNKIGYSFNGYKSPTRERRRNRHKPNVKNSRGAHECGCKKSAQM